MRDYDFKSLSDKDFEILVCDLLSKEEKVRFERFKPGKDGGIDGRYFTSTDDQIILQCKHWARSTVPALVRALRVKELPKLKKFNPIPIRYLLATSLELSPKDKKEIKEALSPFVVSETDVFGNEDVNDLLGKYKDIERQHYKLWISGANVLDTFFNNAILGRSDFIVKDILERSPKYVTTSIHSAAKKMLDKQRVVIITGEPGVGKTTLAEQLCIQCVRAGFQLVVVGDSIEEVENIFRKDELQIFYFDDFLGRNYLSALNRHEDTRIVSFIRRISGDKTKRFVLTSRTNVLNQGKRLSDTFSIANVDKSEFAVHVSSLTSYEKAKLLYNHVWFSQLEISYIEEILKDKRYRTIIEHSNFNPRLISFITDPQRLVGTQPKEYWGYIQDKLHYPADVWQHTYESQLDDFSRAIVLIVVLNGGAIDESELREAYYRILEDPIAAGYSGGIDFNSNIRTLTGSLLNRSIWCNDDVEISLFNPSVADYVINRIKGDNRLIEAVFVATPTKRSARNLSALASNSIISKKTTKQCFAKLMQRYLLDSPDEIKANYKLNLIKYGTPHCKGIHSVLELVAHFLKNFPADGLSISNLLLTGEAIRVLLIEQIFTGDDAWQLLRDVDLDSLTHEELEIMSYICQFLSGERKKEVSEALRQSALTYWAQNITQEIEDRGVLATCYDFSEKGAAEDIVAREIHDILRGYGLPFGEPEIQLIIKQCKIDRIIDDNINRDLRGEYEDNGELAVDMSDDTIDDLFTIDLPSR